MWREQCEKEKLKFEYDHPDDFTRCFWQKQTYVLPFWIVYRLFQILYFTIILGWCVIFNPEGSPVFLWYKNFIYVSTWSTYLQWMVFVIAFAITVDKFVKEKKDPKLPPVKEMPWHYKFLWFFYNMAASVAVVITVMYWLFLYSPDKNINLWFAISCKLFNSVLILIDMFVYAIPYRLLHFYIPPLFGTAYLIFSLIYQFSGGTGAGNQIAIYDVVDWRNPGKGVGFFFIFVSCAILSHLGVFTIHVAKHWLKKPGDEAK